ncbi:MAG TPA: DUF6632 domain-containing protein [Terriglobales bacterium]|nr:DUF6632 domain-containing protein [Terriglobales bacterium]
MSRERALKAALVVIGLLFVATVYPMLMMFRQDPALAMMLSVYATLGVFLLLAVRNPSNHRGLIGFTAWSSFAHAIIMGLQAYLKIVQRGELIGVAVLVVIGVILSALAPAKLPKQRTLPSAA